MIRKGKEGELPSKSLVYIRDLTKIELETIQNGNNLLSELTIRSPYKHFQDRYDKFKSQIKLIESKTANRDLQSHDLDSVYGALDDLLSSLKGFEDRTKSIISERYGKDSTQMSEFQKALSYEFDNKFEYRFCYNLRNYSQHKGSHIGHVATSAKLVNEKPVSSFEVVINGNELLSKYTKWHSMVKNDLSKMDYDFYLIPIIDELRFSCSRVFCKYLVAQEDEINEAIKGINEVVGEYNLEIEGPTIMNVHEGFNKSGGQITLTSIRMNLIDSLRPILKDMKRIASIK